MSGYDLPALNAGLNATATVLLLAGFAAVKLKRIRLHKVLMLSALAASALFLTSYLVYHFAVRGGQATPYTGASRQAYLALLLSHTALAALAAPLAAITAGLGLTGRLKGHKRIARVTLPIWLYVSVTGVLIYWILKDAYPSG